MKTNKNKGINKGIKLSTTINAGKVRGRTIFYISSLTKPTKKQYTVQYIRRAHRRFWACTCEDYTYRRLPFQRACKHIILIRNFAKNAKGVVQLAKHLRANL